MTRSCDISSTNDNKNNSYYQAIILTCIEILMKIRPLVANEELIDSWFNDSDRDQAMQDDHAYLWQHFIRQTLEQDLSRASILDYGCNRGGFLRLLHGMRPYAQAHGVDVALDALNAARQTQSMLPITFDVPSSLQSMPERFDIAFSHEVLYLLPNLAQHAALIRHALKAGGVYYAAIGCHTGNPLWPSWHQLVRETTQLPAHDYSLDDYAEAFWQNGFKVEMRQFNLQNYIPIKPQSYYRTAQDCLLYHTQTKTIIRAMKDKSDA